MVPLPQEIQDLSYNFLLKVLMKLLKRTNFRVDIFLQISKILGDFSKLNARKIFS